MNIELMDKIKAAAYLHWEQTCTGNVLDHWDCAEDIACFLEQHNILDEYKIQTIVRLGINHRGYLEFIRHIAYRIFLYTNTGKANDNWLMAERLVHNKEWCMVITEVARKYRSYGTEPKFYDSLHCGVVRSYYITKCLLDKEDAASIVSDI